MRRLSSLLVAAPLFVSVVGCGDDTHEHIDPPKEIDQRAVAPDPTHGFQIKVPEKVLEVGADVQTCFVPDVTFDHDTFLKKADAYQGSMGHHVVVFGSAVPRTPGEVFDCSDLSIMSSLLPLVTPSFPLLENANERELPENMFLRIPANSLIVLQSHYVNYGDAPIRTADIVNFETLDDVTGMVEASFFVASNNDFTLPTGQSQVTYECDVEATTDLNLIFMIGHMHEQGKAFKMTRRPAGAADAAAPVDDDEVLYDIPSWTSDMRDNAPTIRYPDAAPLVLHPGDHLTVTCDYNNATGHEIEWPHEMCTSFSAYYPAIGDGFLLCE